MVNGSTVVGVACRSGHTSGHHANESQAFRRQAAYVLHFTGCSKPDRCCPSPKTDESCGSEICLRVKISGAQIFVMRTPKTSPSHNYQACHRGLQCVYN